MNYKEIVEICTSKMKIDAEIDIYQKSRIKSVVICRQLCMSMIYEHTQLTQQQIGDLFNVSHSAVKNSKDAIWRIIHDQNNRFNRQVNWVYGMLMDPLDEDEEGVILPVRLSMKFNKRRMRKEEWDNLRILISSFEGVEIITALTEEKEKITILDNQ